jgi:hypothetical protein
VRRRYIRGGAEYRDGIIMHQLVPVLVFNGNSEPGPVSPT